MIKLLPAIILLAFASTQAFSTDFKNTTGNISDYFPDPDAAALTSTLTHLRDVGGYTPNRATACISLNKYEQYLRASWGTADFYPTKEECWPTEYNQSVQATGICANARSSYTEDAYKTLVCEFETGSWLSSKAWISVVAVAPK